MIWVMSEPTSTSEPATSPVATTTPPPPPPPPADHTPPPPYRQSRLNQVAAWVGIVAGIVFIVAVVFGTGFMVGKHSGRGGFERGHGAVMFRRPSRWDRGDSPNGHPASSSRAGLASSRRSLRSRDPRPRRLLLVRN